MKMKKIKYILLMFVFLYLCKNTIPIKYLVPVCYRLDLSMALVLLAAAYLPKGDKKVVILFVVKEVLALLCGNPGISFFWHLLITLSNTFMDLAMLVTFNQFIGFEGMKRFLVGTRSALAYVCFCVVLNVVCHVHMSAAAYGADLSGLVAVAGRYNTKVQGFWSLHFNSIAQFYFAKYLLNLGLTAILAKIFFSKEEE